MCKVNPPSLKIHDIKKEAVSDSNQMAKSKITSSKLTSRPPNHKVPYRWLRPRDGMRVEHYLNHCTPIQKQLLGVSYSGGRGYTSPTPEDAPLKAWHEEHGISSE